MVAILALGALTLVTPGALAKTLFEDGLGPIATSFAIACLLLARYGGRSSRIRHEAEARGTEERLGAIKSGAVRFRSRAKVKALLINERPSLSGYAAPLIGAHGHSPSAKKI